jgi:pyruvate,water dikinase
MVKNPYILGFNRCTLESLPRVGGKNASLGEMLKAGIPVPPGFAVTTVAYEEFLKENQLNKKIQKILSEVDQEDPSLLENISKDIRDLLESAPIPNRIEDGIKSSYERLSGEFDVEELPVAVRSSATAEDLPGASFAGQQDTFLWVKDSREVLRKVRQCWSSIFTSRAISYRKKMGFLHEETLISVGIQKMVDAEAAGVMFTINPMNGDPSKIAIDANWGLGESVVQGEMTPDSFMVDKVTLEILKRNISDKSICYLLNEQTEEVECVDVLPENRQISCLNDPSLTELARLGKLIEQYYGKPQDIEWAIDCNLPFPDNIFIVQSRPETVWSQKEPEPIVEGKKSAMELILDHLCPSQETDHSS